jgi:hypothetical protein
MSYQSKVTTDHDEIRRWVEARGGVPAIVEGTGTEEQPGILGIDFPGRAAEEPLAHIPWESFFEEFEEHSLAFLYQEVTAEGDTSRFHKLIGRETAQERRAA